MNFLRPPLLAVALAIFSGCSASPPVVLLTDFGLQDDAVGLMRGVVHSIAPGAPIADLSHAVRRYDVAQGARRLADAPGTFPGGAVFVVVIDPGVGTGRRALVARLADGTLVVAPDNGVITLAATRHGPVTVRAATNDALVLPVVTATFHGRDVFAPLGAHLAAGVPFEEVGPVVDDWVRLEVKEATRSERALHGLVEDHDQPFGNVWTNIPAAWAGEVALAIGDQAVVEIGDRRLEVPFARTFGDVPVGAPLLYENSRGRLAFAVNRGDFAETYGVRVEARVEVRKKAGR